MVRHEEFFAEPARAAGAQHNRDEKATSLQPSNYPSTWAQQYGKGRSFYTSMGHRLEVWNDPVFQQILVGGLKWAVGDVEADVTPNIDKVTPQANTP